MNLSQLSSVKLPVQPIQSFWLINVSYRNVSLEEISHELVTIEVMIKLQIIIAIKLLLDSAFELIKINRCT